MPKFKIERVTHETGLVRWRVVWRSIPLHLLTAHDADFWMSRHFTTRDKAVEFVNDRILWTMGI